LGCAVSDAAAPVYIIFAVVRASVGAVHRSRVASREGAVGIRRDVFPAVRMFVGWGPVSFWWCVFIFNSRISVYLEFPVGLVVRVLSGLWGVHIAGGGGRWGQAFFFLIF